MRPASIALVSAFLLLLFGCGQDEGFVHGVPFGSPVPVGDDGGEADDGMEASAEGGRVDDAPVAPAEDEDDTGAPDGPPSNPPEEPEAPEPEAPAEPRLGPPYPIVLAHGFFGFEEFAGVGFATYFYGVRDRLAQGGEVLVFTPAVDPFNDSVVRGHQLIAHIEAILEETGHEKVNLIGHSQGGLDARVVAHLRPDLVASVTTLATPHHGTPVADIVLRLVPHEEAHDLIDAVVRLAGAPLYDAVDGESSIAAPMWLFSEQGIAEFNADHPDDPSVAYFSLTGRTGHSYGWPACDTTHAPEFVRRHAAHLDPVDPLLYISHRIVGGVFRTHPNDGLVRVEDAKWGTFLGCIPADHLDQVGHLFGDLPGLFNPWRHGRFYEDLVAWLREQGF